jgi:fumarate reductase subunit D
MATPKRTGRTTAEPFVWLLFSGGGMVAALTLPMLVFLFGVAIPFGLVPVPDHADLLALLRHPLTRLGLLVICAMSLVHAAHRLRFTVDHGLQVQRYDALIATACYGAALLGTAAAGYLLLVML